MPSEQYVKAVIRYWPGAYPSISINAEPATDPAGWGGVAGLSLAANVEHRAPFTSSAAFWRRVLWECVKALGSD